jgi:predicted Rossmann fold nucleotide-binding protein DprA/Smf involved in DNA uptake
MKVAIVGSRSITSYEALSDALTNAPDDWMDDPHFVSGGADGVDSLAESYARRNDVSIDVIEPDYDDWSRGHPAKVRNTRIVEESDAVIALWDGSSNGTRDTIDKALDRGVPVYVEVM